MKILPADSVNLVLTSPPYALHFKKEYWNVEKADYVDWFLSFAHEIFRVLKENGSFVLNIGGSHNKGTPTRSLYHFKLLIALEDQPLALSMLRCRDLLQKIFWPHSIVVTNKGAPQHLVWSVNFCNRSGKGDIQGQVRFVSNLFMIAA